MNWKGGKRMKSILLHTVPWQLKEWSTHESSLPLFVKETLRTEIEKKKTGLAKNQKEQVS